jgi:hypothetical protein
MITNIRGGSGGKINAFGGDKYPSLRQMFIQTNVLLLKVTEIQRFESPDLIPLDFCL